MNVLYSYYFWREIGRRKITFDSTVLAQREIVGGAIDPLLDSGAFSAFTQGIEIDIDEYARWLLPHIEAGLITNYINLDVVRDPEGSERNQRYLERRWGLKPIPVFHAGSDTEYLKKMCEEYPYVALGGMAIAKAPSKSRAWAIRMFQIAEPYGTRLHALGQTSPRMHDLPWYSADSSSWSTGGRYGRILIYDPRSTSLKTIVLQKRGQDIKALYEMAPILRDLGLDPADAFGEDYYWGMFNAASALSCFEWEAQMRRRMRRTMGEAWDGRPKFYYVIWPWQGEPFAKLWRRWTELRGDGLTAMQWRPVMSGSGAGKERKS